MKKYKDIHQHQYTLLPPNLDELIDVKHLVRVIDRFVSTLSPSVWDVAFPGGGAPSYHPLMMLKVILYAYCGKIFSCRQIAKGMRQDVTFMWLSGMQRPNFNTINRFRSEYFLEILEDVFTELLNFLHAHGYISFTDYFVDGTKLESDAGRYTYVWKKNTDRYTSVVQKRVKQLFEEIDRLNLEEDEKYGDHDLPERGEASDLTSDQIRDAASKLNDQVTKIEQKKQQRMLRTRIKRLEKEADRMEKYEDQKRLLKGRNSYSKTDPDATFMRLKDDRLRAAYNVQLSSENQFLTNYSVSQNASDSASFPAHLKKIIERGETYLPKNFVGDCGYGSEENYHLLEHNKVNKYLKYNTFHSDQKQKRKKPFHPDNFIYDHQADRFQCPAGKHLHYLETIKKTSQTGFVSHVRVYECTNCASCSKKSQCTKAKGNRRIHYNPRLEHYKNQAWANLISQTGIKLRKRRGVEIETFFGDLRRNRSFNRFSLRGLKKVELELGLLAIGYNLKKLAHAEMTKAVHYCKLSLFQMRRFYRLCLC